jgi:hypothetical protein
LFLKWESAYAEQDFSGYRCEKHISGGLLNVAGPSLPQGVLNVARAALLHA